MKQDGITRGPWTIEGPDQFGDFNIHHPADRLAIGAVVSNLRPSEEVAANAHFIVAACNAYEPMREALENARALWGHRCFDTPQLTWLAQVDAALSTLPVNDRQTSDDVGILRDAARRAHDTLIEINQYNYTHADVCELNDASVEAILILADAIGERHGKTEKWWNDRRAALKGVPQPASDDYQADASAPALSEKVTSADEQRRWPGYIYDPDDWEYTCNWEDRSNLTDDADIFLGDVREFATLTEGPRLYATLVPLSFDENGDADETEIQWFWSREEAEAATNRQPADGWVNFSNNAESDAVSLKSDTSLQPASEAGKLSTDELAYNHRDEADQ